MPMRRCGHEEIVPFKRCRHCDREVRDRKRGRPARPYTRLAGTAEERLWGRVDRSAGPDACWPWTGSTSNGYGVIKFDGVQHYAHRKVAELSGLVLGDLSVLHRCDNPLCCNPAHLFLGTHDDNMRDMVAKGRHWRHA